MSIVITLAPEEEAQLQKLAEESGETIEETAMRLIRLALSRQMLPPDNSDLPEKWRGIVGAFHSGDGSLSQDTGRKFAEGMEQKRREGHL